MIHPLLIPANTPQAAASFLLAQKRSGGFVLTLNTEILARGLSDPAFGNLIACAPYRVCDSIGAKWLLTMENPQWRVPRIAGVDLGRGVLAVCEKERIPVFLLGGRPGVAESARENLGKAHPDLPIVGTAHGYFSHSDLPALRGLIVRSGAEVVFVCLGSPMQEEWILRNRRCLPKVSLFLPLGGSLDVYAGRLPRAPIFWQRAGLEWLWRILTAPDRGRRIRRLQRAVCVLLFGFFQNKLSNAVGFPTKCVELNNRL